MAYQDRRPITLVTWMAGIAACVVALGLPIIYLGLSFFHQAATLEAEAEINSRIVTRMVNANPDLWQYEEMRLIDILSRRPSDGVPEVRRIRDLAGSVVAETVEQLGSPVLTRENALMDSGAIVGTIEISRSFRPFLWKAAFLALLGGLLGLAIFFTIKVFPIRSLQRALLSLAEEKERAQVTLRSIGDGVITADPDGKVVFINAAGESLTGWPQHEAAGRSLNEIFRILDDRGCRVCEDPVRHVLREARLVECGQTMLISRDGTERRTENSGAPILGGNGTAIGVVIVFRDITEKQRLEAEVRKASHLDSLGILAGGIAHDFNNILTSILGNISLAMADTRAEDEIYDRLQSAESACLRAKDLTLQLLTFARGGTPVKQTVSLADQIRSSVDFALTGSNVRCEIRIDDDLPAANADAGQINQVIHNLVINAVEAMPGGGLITLRAERIQLDQTGPIPLPPGLYIRVSVQDRGAGVPKEKASKIFEPYFTTKKRGSGLGLATCYSIIRNHGGYINVESGQGAGGALFYFYLPASPSPVSEKRTSTEDRDQCGKGSVLLMDDEKFVREVAGDMLARLGYDVAFAADGADAIEQYRRARESGKGFDAVIMDLTVPGGMGGKDAIQRIREFDPMVKAIVSSGYSENSVMSDFSRWGFGGVLPKPYNIRVMGRVLRSVMRETDGLNLQKSSDSRPQ